MYTPSTYLLVIYFPTYLRIYEAYFLQKWLTRWNQIVTQLRFRHPSSGWCSGGCCWFTVALKRAKICWGWSFNATNIVALLNSGNKSLSSYRQKLNAHKTRGRLGWHKRLQNRLKGRRRRACYIQLELQMHNRWKEIFKCSTGERRSVSCTCNFIPVSLADRPGESKHKSSKQKTLPYFLSTAHAHHHDEDFSDQFCVIEECPDPSTR